MKNHRLEDNICHFYLSARQSLNMPPFEIEVNIFTYDPAIDVSQLPSFNRDVCYHKISSAEECELHSRYIDLNIIIIDSKESESLIDIAKAARSITFILVHQGYHLKRNVPRAYYIPCWDEPWCVLLHVVSAVFLPVCFTGLPGLDYGDTIMAITTGNHLHFHFSESQSVESAMNQLIADNARLLKKAKGCLLVFIHDAENGSDEFEQAKNMLMPILHKRAVLSSAMLRSAKPGVSISLIISFNARRK
ncbi:hypothetical protein [Edaphovirga cremea]|uniref:hypothetical protein n=1 Tax=Edaphovirga cremea TaxID=2267246 RepID=UPI000DEEC8DE|nr:hypothetical protein [Edaphovirga cremea]